MTLSGDGIQLPSLPEVALQIRNVLAAQTPDIDQVAGLIGTDPALAARLLQVANCALFHRGTKPVQDIHKAIMRLGLKMVHNVSVSLAAQQVFVGYGTRAIRPYIIEVWRHSVHVATLAHLFTTRTSDVAAEESFLAGLLHEIGKLYILMRAKDHLELFNDQNAFRAVLSDWQARVGAGITRAWGFPDELTAAVADHQSCALSCQSPVSLTEIVAVANHLAERMDEAPHGQVLLDDLPHYGALNPDRETLAWMLSATANEIRTLQDALAI
jgi:HD-like signal output (HDOD) protein